MNDTDHDDADGRPDASPPYRWREAAPGTAAVLAFSFGGSSALAVAALLALVVARGCERLVRHYRWALGILLVAPQLRQATVWEAGEERS